MRLDNNNEFVVRRRLFVDDARAPSIPPFSPLNLR